RSDRDWSSDVCSSDLMLAARGLEMEIEKEENRRVDGYEDERRHVLGLPLPDRQAAELFPRLLQRRRPEENPRQAHPMEHDDSPEIGRASCRERGESSV